MDELYLENSLEEDDIPEMELVYNRHYITTDSRWRITDGWSDGPHPEKDTSEVICINEQGGYQFRLFPDGEENPPLYTMEGIPIYKWDGNQVLKRTAEEMEEDRVEVPEPLPTQEEDLLAMAIDHEFRLTMLELGVSEV